MTTPTNRRQFLKTTTATAAAGIGFWVAAGSRAAQSSSPNEQINFACIGVGGKGRSDSESASAHGNIVAICDVDANTREGRADAKGTEHPAKFRQAKQFSDYRKMFDAMGDKIDAVTVSTPDHTHAVAAAMAMRQGKHCFCQKPLTHSIYEARRLGELARENDVATQMGNQGTSHDGLRRAAAVIRSGAIGAVKHVHVWTNRPIWPQGKELNRPEDTPPIPGHLDWEAFLGPAAYRPFNEAYHPFKWRGWWDFGTGALGDMACHTMNMPFAALDLRDPVSVRARTSGHNGETYPEWSVIDYRFPRRKGRPALTLTWYDGGQLPPELHVVPEKPSKSGCLVLGEHGAIFSPNDYGAAYTFYSHEGIEEPEVEFTPSPGHFQEWVDAMRGGPAAMSNFPDYAGPLSETVLLGNLAVWSGKRVKWDAEKLEATNAPELASMVRPEYRKGYSL